MFYYVQHRFQRSQEDKIAYDTWYQYQVGFTKGNSIECYSAAVSGGL